MNPVTCVSGNQKLPQHNIIVIPSKHSNALNVKFFFEVFSILFSVSVSLSVILS